jgi:hypothetical protein
MPRTGKGDIAQQKIRYRARVIAEQRFHCSTCNHSYQSGSTLRKHMISRKHIRNQSTSNITDGS